MCNGQFVILRAVCLAGIVFFGAATSADAEPGREATPAVVNPVFRSALRQTISLDGQWDFATDPNGVGEAKKWFLPKTALPGKVAIQVPACWEAQGIGGPGRTTSSAPERRVRRIIGSYVGTAWYKKRVAIPKAWAGKQVWLKVGGVSAQGWLWVNGTYVTHVENYCGTYKYNITDMVTPGKDAVVAAKIRNDVSTGKGLFAWIHRFGGLYRSVEIDATPDVLIDYAYVDGLFDRKTAKVNVKLRSTGAKVSCRVEVAVSTPGGKPAGRGDANVAVAAKGDADVTVEVPLDPFSPWSPARASLYRADIVLKIDGKRIDGWVERFGVRKWEVRGGNFYLNGRKYYLRGYGDDFIYPITLASPASRQTHRKNMLVAKEFGFNFARLHTHCEVPEYFQAADEVGIMIQPELPYYSRSPSAGKKDPKWFRPKADLRELITHYRRYVSVSTYCGGNEGHMGSPIDKELYQLAKKLDPTRLFLHQDGGRKNSPANSDFDTLPHTKTDKLPWFVHEYTNLATDEDPREAPQYTGALAPEATLAPFKKTLAESGLSLKWGYACLDAGIALQRLYQKRQLESLRLRAAGDGYTFWTIVDCGKPSAQGLFTQFWQPKAGTTAKWFRRFNGPSALLVKFSPAGQVLTEGDELKVELWISHFAPADIADDVLTWSLAGAGKQLTSGKVSSIRAGTGDVKAIAKMDIKVPPVDRPVKARLTASLSAAKIENSWDLWLFPKLEPKRGAGKGLCASAKVHAALAARYPGIAKLGAPAAAKADIILTDSLNDAAIAGLQAGKSVILLRLGGRKPGVKLGWWWKAEQMGTAVARHPAFGSFPHDGHMNELFFRIVGDTVSLTKRGYGKVEPLMVGNGYDRRAQCSGGIGHLGYLLHVFQAKAAKGRILGCGLNLLSTRPEAAWLLNEFITYVGSDRFKPKGVLDLAEVKAAKR